MRIRTDGDYAYRKDVIERAADYYGCNKTKAVTQACEDVPELVAAARQVIEREDLTVEQRQEIAETLSTKAIDFEVQSIVTMETN